jgi:hypothetical protein
MLRNVALAVMPVVVLAAGAPAQAAPTAVEKCSAETTNYSSSEKTRVIWKLCISDRTGPNYRIEVQCQLWSFFNGWFDNECELRGVKVLRKDGALLDDRPGGFQWPVSRSGSIITTRFTCQGSGTYSASLSEATVYPGYPHEDYAPARMPDTTVSTHMC